MLETTKLLSRTGRSAQGGARERWHMLRDLLGGALVLVAWAALWTGVWAAVDGPLSPIHAEATQPPAAVATSD